MLPYSHVSHVISSLSWTGGLEEEEEEGVGSLALKGIELWRSGTGQTNQLFESTAHIWSSHRLANWHLLELAYSFSGVDGV